ncbi:camp-dependent protein kinase [Nesidiocoris tenuis]|nr:camp-dependent protein kinase [Nesidiocoris tenuis]
MSPSRRKTVCGPSFDPRRDMSPTDVHPKAEAEVKKLRSILSKVPVLAELDELTLKKVILAMENRTVSAGQVIIKEGDEADFFYVIESGTYEVSHADLKKNQVIKTYTDGGYFGELSLLHDQPRSATVTAKTSGKLWALSRQNFKKTVVMGDMQRRRKYAELIGKVEILHNLSEDEKDKVSEALETRKFKKGQTIISQGDEANGMFFIEEGQVIITVSDKNNQQLLLSSLKPGDYFGELALLTHHPRAANATAETDVVLAFLNVEAFERLLGSCDAIMRRNVKTYENQMKKLFKASEVPRIRK